MPNEWFRFRHFTIHQDKCAMKVGTDSVLLASWTPLEGHERKIADLGTGTGILALIMAQRSDAAITAFESDKDAATQASENFASSPWQRRLECHQKLIQQVEGADFDLCIFNPPFFTRQLSSPQPTRNQARHMGNQHAGEWFQACQRLLNEHGKLSFIIPVQEEAIWVAAASQAGFYPHSKTLVAGSPGRPNVRVLYWMGRTALPLIHQSSIVLQSVQRGEYSAEFEKLVREIYPESHFAKNSKPID
ncbi:MAG: methyltransferase [Bacteroidia bacterium]|nr:methyltransferase [Bacteroidia bacterium]